MGDGTSLPRYKPIRIRSSGVEGMSAGNQHSMYLDQNGSLWSMGVNTQGELGDGTTTQRLSPVQVAVSGIAWVTTSYSTSFFMDSGGTLWGMGQNNLGQLGDGSTTIRLSPAQVLSSALSRRKFSPGVSNTMFIKEDGSLWGMGQTANYRMGDGQDTVDLLVPTQILSGAETNPRLLTLNLGTGGASVSGAGKKDFNAGASISATPSPGYLFSSWAGDFISTDANASVTMNANKEVNATFVQDTADNDGDGLTNYRELAQLGSDPDDNDTDGDGLGDGTEDQLGLNPAVADTALMSYFANREDTARSEGNASGIAYVQANPATYSLYSTSEVKATEVSEYARGYAQGLTVGALSGTRTGREEVSTEGVSSVRAFTQQARPHTRGWYYQPQWGWLFTNDQAFPYVLRVRDGKLEWLFFGDSPDLGEASFYDEAAKSWFSPSDP